MNTIEEIKKIKTRIKGTYKYKEGTLQNYKDIGYHKTYYNNTKCFCKCDVCGIPVVVQSQKRHQLSYKCINNKISVDE